MSETVPYGISGAIEALTKAGYVVLKAKSYRRAQERQRIAECRARAAEEHEASTRKWMERDVFPWERHLVQRVDHLAGLAARLGATPADMRGPDCTCGMSSCGSRLPVGPKQDAFPVWREDSRIRNAAGTGYVDTVTDDEIRRHVSEDLAAGHCRNATFRVAVLSLRQQERASS